MNNLINDLRKINNEQRDNIKEIRNELVNVESNINSVNNNDIIIVIPPKKK